MSRPQNRRPGTRCEASSRILKTLPHVSDQNPDRQQPGHVQELRSTSRTPRCSRGPGLDGRSINTGRHRAPRKGMRESASDAAQSNRQARASVNRPRLTTGRSVIGCRKGLNAGTRKRSRTADEEVCAISLSACSFSRCRPRPSKNREPESCRGISPATTGHQRLCRMVGARSFGRGRGSPHRPGSIGSVHSKNW